MTGLPKLPISKFLFLAPYCTLAISVFLNVRVISDQGIGTHAPDCTVENYCKQKNNILSKLFLAACCHY